MTIGQYLRAHREHMGYRLEDVSAAINIRVSQLRAIENDQPDQLPGMIYAVGFVKTYAQFLNLDANAVVEQFKIMHSANAETAKKKKDIKKTITDDPYLDNRVPTNAVMGIAALFFLVCLGLWWFSKPDTNEQLEALNTVPPPPVVETVSDSIEIPMDVPTEPEELAEDEVPMVTDEPEVEISNDIEDLPKPVPLKEKEQLQKQIMESRITITALETTWLEVMDGSRRILYKQLLQQGQSFKVPETDQIYLSTGNAGALEFTVDGKKLLPIGATGDILRSVLLTPEILVNKAQ